MSQNFDLNDPYILGQFIQQIQTIINNQNSNLNFNKEMQCVIVDNPTISGFANIVLNGVVGDVDTSKTIPNVRVRPGLRVAKNNECYVNCINGNTSNIYVDINKNSNLTDLCMSTLTISSNSVLNVNDAVCLVSSSSGTVTITLPDATKCSGKIFIIKKTDISSNAITVTPYGTQKIDGSSTMVISTTYPKRWVISDGSNWWILN